MARKVLRSADGEGFLRAAWDAMADMLVDYGVVCSWSVKPSTRRGIFVFRLHAYVEGTAPESLAQAAYVCEYPTAQVASLEACLYRATIKLDFQLEQPRRFPSGKA